MANFRDFLKVVSPVLGAAGVFDKEEDNSGLKMVGAEQVMPTAQADKPAGMKKGGAVKSSSASRRADGIATKGKTKGRMV